MAKVYLAVDIGAGSGRMLAGMYDGKSLRFTEVCRFANNPITLPSGIHWNIIGLYEKIQEGIATAIANWGDQLAGIAVDTWGCDYGLLCPEGNLLGIPYCYRDKRTEGIMALVESKMPLEEIYRRTGIQSAFFNTLPQLVAENEKHSRCLQAANRLLFIPDLLNYFMTGVIANERTVAGTSQLYSTASKGWDREVIKVLGLPQRLFGELVDPGTMLGHTEVAGKRISVFTVGSHDTASAVVAANSKGEDSAFLSSGSWSLLGAELEKPILSNRAAKANFTNEVGVGATVRFLKNISGMWLLQQCLADWNQGRAIAIDYHALLDAAKASKPFQAFIDPDANDFVEPGNMPQRISDCLKKSGQPVVDSIGGITRIILESLTLKYRLVFNELQELTSRNFRSLRIVGGGAKNAMLNQFIADALKIEVVAGPYEASSIGNILVQMMADGEIDSLEEGNQLVHAAVDLQYFEPMATGPWDEAFSCYSDRNGLPQAVHP